MLRERALEALKKSTTMLRVASSLQKQGNLVEAERLRAEARKQRTISTTLMAEANTRDITSETVAYQYHRPTNTAELNRH